MRRMRPRLLLGGLLTTAVALAAAGGVAQSHGRGVRTQADLRPYTAPHAGVVVNAGVRGEARTRTRDGHTEVRLRAAGLPRNATFGARLYNGRCADHGTAFKFDTDGPATRENEVWLDLRTADTRAAGDRIRVRPLPSGRVFSIVVHEHANPDAGDRIACGDLLPD